MTYSETNKPNLQRSLTRLTAFLISSAALLAAASAEAAPEYRSSASAQAGVTIISRSVEIRTDEFRENGGWDSDASGTEVVPIGESRRPCRNSANRPRCRVVVFDMP